MEPTNNSDNSNEPYTSWLARLFPRYVDIAFAAYHHEFWRWVWALTPGMPADAYVAIWPRGAGK